MAALLLGAAVLGAPWDCGFPINVSGVECQGLTSAPNATGAADCAAACCADSGCAVWQWCDPRQGKACASGGGGCWIGRPSSCGTAAALWQGGRRVLPVGNVTAALQSPTAAKKIPYALGPNRAPSGEVFSVDSVSMSIGSRRWYAVSGEIHLARVPAGRWREELMRMQGGGLDMIAVYIFWIHHEEEEGKFDFTGRRDVAAFMRTATELGLKVLLRVGPWDHGECRNGGHPDWLVARSREEHFALRANNTGYLKYVGLWYNALAAQLNGTYWSEGGPVVGVQLDNETPDWQYLLALRELALDAGMNPPTFTKTGWPSPSKGCPSDLPLLPFFGGYADRFWSNDMHSDPASAQYLFAQKPSLSAAQRDGGKLGWDVPPGYPWLDVEVGGGMAAAYNHRTHMDSADMPAMHLCDVANGANNVGYYMYHGGNNPRSRNGDDPEQTLQESSFQPAGAANPMPSFSYDFYAPLGEFGQPRTHYHQMRRLHLLLRDYGHQLAEMPLAAPDVMPQDASDQGTLRWAVRSNGSSGFLFVNNYQRLQAMPQKTQARFALTFALPRPGGVLHIPSQKSAAVTVAADSWFVWPFGIAAGAARIAWATAQLLCSVRENATAVTVFLSATSGVLPELAVGASGVTVTAAAGVTLGREGDDWVARGIAPGRGAAVTATSPGGSVRFVVLTTADADRLWKVQLGGAERAAISDAPLLLSDAARPGELLLRSEAATADLWLHPAPAELRGAAPLTGTADGVFSRYSCTFRTRPAPKVTATLRTPAGPPREVPKQLNGKAREPDSKDWGAAAVYDVAVGPSSPGWQGELRLAIDYAGDAARVTYGGAVLTDNWQSGYTGDGALEVGLSYLAGEHPGLDSEAGANLTLSLLPLKKETLEKDVFLQKQLWPHFPSSGVALSLRQVRAVQVNWLSLSAAG